jgi:hypothetical protein
LSTGSFVYLMQVYLLLSKSYMLANSLKYNGIKNSKKNLCSLLESELSFAFI